MHSSCDFEKDYHAVLARIFARLSDLPLDVSWWAGTICLSDADLLGVDRNHLFDIGMRMESEGLVDKVEYQKELPDNSSDYYHGLSPEQVGFASGPNIYPMAVCVTERFELDVPEKLAKWEADFNTVRKESATKVVIRYTPSTGFTREEGSKTLMYAIQQDSKRYAILSILNKLGPSTRKKIHEELPTQLKGQQQQISKDIRDINKQFHNQLKLSHRVITHSTSQRRYRLNKDNFFFEGIV